MTSKFGLKEFRKKYGTHEQCLEVLKQLRFPDPCKCPKCNIAQKFYPVTGRTSYACNNCGHHIYPLAGTIFEKSTTPLDLWFFAMYLMTQTRSGTSAKQLERMLGVTYKTAWRIFKQIRMLMAQIEGNLLDGIVEIDETFIGGKGSNRRFVPHFNEVPKEAVMGIIQRGGKAYLKHIPNTGKWTLLKQIKANVSPQARIVTDEWAGYIHLKRHGYTHNTVNHHKTYVDGDIHTQNAENVWSQLKRGIYGVYRVVSKKYLQAYVDEYAWRYNNRKLAGRMFDRLLHQVVEVRGLSVEQLV